jgi:hypothetical protein
MFRLPQDHSRRDRKTRLRVESPVLVQQRGSGPVS